MIEKWHTPTGTELTWGETLDAMCLYYGTFCGRWHPNEFWAKVKEELPNLTESQCKDKIQQIESDADSEMWNWRMSQ